MTPAQLASAMHARAVLFVALDMLTVATDLVGVLPLVDIPLSVLRDELAALIVVHEEAVEKASGVKLTE